MPKPGWSVRRNQLVTTYGVGALVTAGVESVMIAGLDRWQSGEPDLHEPRLERQLGVNGFRRPPASEEGDDVPVVRFPSWVFCPNPPEVCEVGLDEHRRIGSNRDNRCPQCGEELVPSRFLIACSRGHVDDFPYFNWVHAGSGGRGRGASHRLRIESSGSSAALRDVRVICSCGEEATLDGAFAGNALRGITGCHGRRPWLPGETDQDCEEIPRVLQRGGSNVWFPVIRSALLIPPWSEGALRLLNKHWTFLRAMPADAVPETLKGLKLHEGSAYSLEDLVRAVDERKQRETGEPSTIPALRNEEFEALIRRQPETGPDDEFVCEPAAEIGEFSQHWFANVMLVRRLLEVRALESFTRILPPQPADLPERRARVAAEGQGWLPAVDIRGEGIFLRLDEDVLREWEERPGVAEQAARIGRRYKERFTERGAEPDREVTPRFILTHTLAHVLIGQWALDSGYPAAALRERLYVSDDHAGMLLYTATSDSAGSLGGVLAQAAPNRLEASLREALERARWCSSDPICIEAEAHGVDSLNLAACHACVLLPEVSCEEMNVLLDRALLIGTPEDPSIGFFQ